MLNYRFPIIRFVAALLLIATRLFAIEETRSERIYLSGTGPDDAVDWDFYCTSGANSGFWTTIPVPSCWETKGFGTFDYGLIHRRVGQERAPLTDEQGLYRFRFPTPENSDNKSVLLVFEGVMTDAAVTLNGHSLGPSHQGSFYRFSYEVAEYLAKDSENLLEVTVSKKSANASVNAAERTGDFWIFGGIFRPVWLETAPQQRIAQAAIDANADGRFLAQLSLSAPAKADSLLSAMIRDSSHNIIAAKEGIPIPRGATSVELSLDVPNPKTWNAETPSLYTATFQYQSAKNSTHILDTRFGFRAVEIRPKDGLYINGTKIQIRGIDRHCFRPDSGRTLSRAQSYQDARLIKSLNANAVRTAHYPPDQHFLEACDELGLYVLDELCGWHSSYDTPTGTALIKSMIARDHNHPSIFAWANGNERGWNTDNDPTFPLHDLQDRPVLHPLHTFSEIDTKHYPDFATLLEKCYGPTLYLPTEFLHGQYGGGTGAALSDYWRVIQNSPTAIGGFLWVLADEGIARPDWNGEIDTAGDLAPDGIFGPRHERDGNDQTIRSLWSPIQASDFNLETAEIRLTNHYDFTNANTCTLEWKLVRFEDASTNVIASSHEKAPAIQPHKSTSWIPELPTNWKDAHALFLTANDSNGQALFTWSWPLSKTIALLPKTENATPTKIYDQGKSLVITWADYQAEFDFQTGQLNGLRQQGQLLPFPSAPKLIAYKQLDKKLVAVAPPLKLEQLAAHQDGDLTIVTATYRDNAYQTIWRIDAAANTLQLDYSFTLQDEVDLVGISFPLPDSGTWTKQWLGYGPHNLWRNRLEGGLYGIWPEESPEFEYRSNYANAAGFWHDWDWLKLDRGEQHITIRNLSGIPHFGIGQPSIQVPSTAPLPDLGLSFLHVIPAIGTKFHAPDRLGPQSIPVILKGTQTGSIRFELP